MAYMADAQIGMMGQQLYDYLMDRYQRSGLTTRPSMEQWAQWAADWGQQNGTLTWTQARDLARQWFAYRDTNQTGDARGLFSRFYVTYANGSTTPPGGNGTVVPPGGVVPPPTQSPVTPTGTPAQQLYDYIMGRYQQSGGTVRPSMEQWAQWAAEWGQQTGHLTWTKAREVALNWYKYASEHPGETGRDFFTAWYDNNFTPVPTDIGHEYTPEQWARLTPEQRKGLIEQATEAIRRLTNPYDPSVKALGETEIQRQIAAANRIFAIDRYVTSNAQDTWAGNPFQFKPEDHTSEQDSYLRYYSPQFSALRGDRGGTPESGGYANAANPYLYQEDPTKAPVVKGLHRDYWTWRNAPETTKGLWYGDLSLQGIDQKDDDQSFESGLPFKGSASNRTRRQTLYGFGG